MISFRKILGRVFRFTLTWLFVFGPPLVCFFVLYHFSMNEFRAAPVEEFYKLVSASIAVTATLSSLTLNLSSRIKDDDKRADAFRHIGERFLHSVLLLVMALIVKFAEVQLLNQMQIVWLATILLVYLKVLLIFFFYYGVGYFGFALILAHENLLQGNTKPYA